MKITQEFVNKHKTEKGGFTREQLLILGVSWPPKKGWMRNVIGKEITDEQEKRFIRHPVAKQDTRIKSSALPWFITSRVVSAKRDGLSESEQACLALEVDEMPCPMHVAPEQWVRANFSYICLKYQEAYFHPASKSAKAKPSKKQRKNKAVLKVAKTSYRPKVAAPLFVSGVDVTSTEFLSTYEWRKVRMMALKKYGPKCMCCGATPADGAVMNVDHIKPRKLYPELALDLQNFQILCNPCNHGKGNWDQTDWRG